MRSLSLSNLFESRHGADYEYSIQNVTRVKQNSPNNKMQSAVFMVCVHKVHIVHVIDSYFDGFAQKGSWVLDPNQLYHLGYLITNSWE